MTAIYLQIIFLVTMYPLIFILYFLLRNAGGRDKPYLYGATLNKAYRTEREVLEITATYQQDLKRTTILFAILPILSFFIPYISILMTFWMLWMLVVCFFPMYYCIKANRKIQELKRKHGWFEHYEISYVELKTISVPKKVKKTTFLFPLVGSIVPVFIAFFLFQGQEYWVYAWIVAMFAVCTVLFAILAVWTDKQKVMVISKDSDINVNYARAKKVAWKDYWLYCSWLNTVFTWFLLWLLFVRNKVTLGLVLGSLVYTLLIIGITCMLLKKLSSIEKSYAGKKEIVDAAEDDRNWLFGILYYNKNDKHYMIQNRYGTGMTVNLAHKGGILTELVAIAAILSVPILCVWMILLEFTPLQLKIENETIICEQLHVEYEIPFAEIVEYKTVTELPDFIKVSGNGMENQLSGTFEVYREGMYQVFLNPQNRLFLYIQTRDRQYYIGGANDEMTKKVLETIEEGL